jgi:hypothetical protein
VTAASFKGFSARPRTRLREIVAAARFSFEAAGAGGGSTKPSPPSSRARKIGRDFD